MCKVSKQAYPAVFDIRNPGNDTNVNNEKQHQEIIEDLVDVLAARVLDDIEELVENATEGAEVVLEPNTTSALLHEVVRLGEREPCGVRGGELLVNFTDGEDVQHQLGSISLDPYTIETYQLQLNLLESKEVSVKMKNVMRKVWGQPRRVVVDNFIIKKNKLYG